jgi:hypothetical protein
MPEKHATRLDAKLEQDPKPNIEAQLIEERTSRKAFLTGLAKSAFAAIIL